MGTSTATLSPPSPSPSLLLHFSHFFFLRPLLFPLPSNLIVTTGFQGSSILFFFLRNTYSFDGNLIDLESSNNEWLGS